MTSSSKIADVETEWALVQRGHAPNKIYDARNTSFLDVIKVANREAYLDHRANLALGAEMKEEADEEKAEGLESLDVPDPEDITRPLSHETQKILDRGRNYG